jgi:Immunoglobulin domain
VSPFYFDAATEGMRTQVMCTTSQGDQPFVFSWLKDGAALHGSGAGLEVNQFSSFSSIVTIDSVRAEHSGNYTCQVHNAAATVEHTAPLSVTGTVSLTLLSNPPPPHASVCACSIAIFVQTKNTSPSLLFVVRARSYKSSYMLTCVCKL